jgi:ABC-2 type transport system permease protein
MQQVTADADPLAEVLPSLGMIALWVVLALVLGSLTLRRRTP